jgi:hypothetical protein
MYVYIYLCATENKGPFSTKLVHRNRLPSCTREMGWSLDLFLCYVAVVKMSHPCKLQVHKTPSSRCRGVANLPASMRRGRLSNQNVVIVEESFVRCQIKTSLRRRASIRINEVHIAISLVVLSKEIIIQN